MKHQKALEPFINLYGILEALPPDRKIPDGVPLIEVLPKLWPTMGDLRKLIMEVATE